MELLQIKLEKVVFARLSEDEDLLEAVTLVANKSCITAGFFNVIGTLKKANLGFYQEGKYKEINVDEPVEIVTCTGKVSVKGKGPFVHAHIAVSNEKGEVKGGHVMQGCVIAATGELVMVEATDARLLRKLDSKTKLFMWSFGK
jgi:predicted DNA-binding protein with PD1-like motif